ncbi:HVA22-like protein k [Citrus sinensis]|uniref:HVA22-like protein k n=2 Tax=Citrus sinensis TaxID=2711 RepID=A0ACB8JG53_CITSI|nr:HVA22-like protein k [Citrus sinensis]KAH9716267.1 HVA22-like protein k [Citrus sinensis]
MYAKPCLDYYCNIGVMISWTNMVLTLRCSVGVALPVYSTFKAIERKDEDEQQKWLLYWAAYGTFSIAEVFADKFLTWFSMYYPLKFAFLVWLQLASTDRARQLYENYLSPFLLRCQAKADQLSATTHAKFDQLRAITQAKVDQLRAITLRPFLLTCQAKIDQLRAIEDMVGHINSIKAEIKCGEDTFFVFFRSDPNKPEVRNAVEDLDGITSDTDT